MISDILFLPHGMQIIEGLESSPLPDFMWLNEKMKSLMNSLSEIPEEIILITPHGYTLEDRMVLYDHQQLHGPIYKLEGSVVYGSPKGSIEFEGSPEMIESISDGAKTSNMDLEVLSHGFPGYPLTLNWGSTVPLYYFKDRVDEIKVTILSYPRVRRANFDKIEQINSQLVKILSGLKTRCMLVISGDLSHVHQEDGPYGYDESSIPFDDLIMQWSKTNAEETMKSILDLEDKALACGMSGLQLIHQLRKKSSFNLKTSFYKVPTYFGMAGFHWSSSN